MAFPKVNTYKKSDPAGPSLFRRTLPGRLLLLCALLTGVCAVIRAQSTFGSFTGTVKDPSGSLVASCKVTVSNTGTSAIRNILTDSAGTYVAVNMEPGNYEITMEAPGFEPKKYTNIVLESRQTIRIDGALSLASQTQTVLVSEAAEAPINTEVSNISETKVGRELNDLPVALSSRASGSTSAFSTLTTQPGVEVDSSNNMSIAGARASQLSISVDGISSMSPRSSAPITELFPSFDAIEEIRVSEVNNTAEFGGISDITTISKSGTNSFHGGAFENNQNTDYDARNTFSATVPKLDMNNFGVFLGGPVWIPKVYKGKDRTFFFGSYEALRLPEQVVLVQSVPSLALRSGNLSAYSNQISNGNGSPLPGNQIPASQISPLSLAALQYLYPLPNTGSPNSLVNNYVTNFPTPISSNQGDLRLDQNLTSKQSIFARITYKEKLGEAAPSFSSEAGSTLQPEHDWALTVAHNWVINPTTVNEVRFGWTGSHTGSSNSLPASVIASELNLQTAGPLPPGDASPEFKISGFQTAGAGASSISQTSTKQVIDNLTLTKGKHTYKFGVDYRYLTGLYTNVFATDRMGVYSFNNSVTKPVVGNAFASFLLGIPDSDTMATVLNPNSNGYAPSYAGYAQDDFKVSSRVTINYGIRYEYHPMFTDHNNNTANFLPNYYSIQNGVTIHGAVVVPDLGVPLINPAFAQSLAPMPILTATQAGVPQNLRFVERTDFAPRIGVAWRVTGDNKTVVRAGYGKFIESELGNLLDAAWAVEASDVAAFTNTIVNGKPTYTFPYAFPSNLAQPGTQVFDLSSAIHYQDPFVQQWNVTFERDLGFQTGLRLSYDGSHGSDLGLTDNPDQVPANTAGFSVAKAAAPYPLLEQIVEETNGGRSNYNAFTVSINKRMSKGLQFQSSYNFAKNLADNGGYSPTAFAGSGGGQTTDFYHPGLDYGNVAFTRRNRFLTTFLYELPFNHTPYKALTAVTSGWELSGVLLFQSGPFLTVLAAGADPSGTNFDNIIGNGRADIVSGVSTVPANQSIYNWINTAAFAIPANNIGRFGDSPVGSVVGAGTKTAALSMFRTFNITERIKFRLGAAATNIANHPNYGNPGLTLGTSSFGIISSLQSADGAGPRSLQMTGRITF
ncbi:MAG: TonB-dependent receptor [Bryobacteraceae bacterium]